MPLSFFVCVAVLALLDIALQKRGELAHGVVYTLLACTPMVVLAYLPAPAIVVLATLVGLTALFNYARLVGLLQESRFFATATVGALGCFVAASVHWYGLFQAMPAFTMSVVVLVAALGQRPTAILQKVCLAWLGALVYGYLWAHAALFVETDVHPLGSGTTWLVLVLFVAKCGDVAWALLRRSGLEGPVAQLCSCTVGATVGGALIGHWSPGLELPRALMLGSAVGLGVAAGARTFNLVVADVVDDGAPVRPLKSAMVFGFAFALALAYHLVRYWS